MRVLGSARKRGNPEAVGEFSAALFEDAAELVCFPALDLGATGTDRADGTAGQIYLRQLRPQPEPDDLQPVRRLILSPFYQERWGHRFALRDDQNNKFHDDTTAGGSRITVSVGGGMLGMGGDINIADDPRGRGRGRERGRSPPPPPPPARCCAARSGYTKRT